MLQLIDAAAQLPNLLPDAFLTLCVCGGALRLQPVQHGSFVQFRASAWARISLNTSSVSVIS